MIRKRGAGGHLSPANQTRLMAFIKQGLPSRTIANTMDCNIRVVQFWRNRSREDRPAVTRSFINGPAPALVAQLCLVNECYREAQTDKKYCALHARTPGQHGVQSHAPMARLMGSR